MKNWLKVRFITGFFVTVPAIATAWVLWVFWSWIDDRFAPIYSRMLGRPVSGWGLGFLTAVSIILIMGTVARNVVGRRVISFGDKVLHRVPVFRLLYPSIKMLIDSFSPERRGSFKAVVLVQHPREGTWAFAFVTSELTLESPVGKGEMVTVFVPTNNLYLGDVVVVPAQRRDLHRADRRGGPARDPLGGHRDALEPASAVDLLGDLALDAAGPAGDGGGERFQRGEEEVVGAVDDVTWRRRIWPRAARASGGQY